MDAGNQRQAGEVWSPELGLLVTRTKARAEKAVWRKRGSCGLVPNSLLHMGPNSAGSVHWLRKEGSGFAQSLHNILSRPQPEAAHHPGSSDRADKLWWASLDWTAPTPHPDRTAQPHRPEGFPLTHSPARFWFTLLFRGDAGVCRAAELVLWFNATAWQIFFLKFFLTEIQVYCWKSKICI